MNARRILLAVPACLVLALLITPLLAMIPMSFSSSATFELIPAQPSLRQYREFFSSMPWLYALATSTKAAVGTTILATFLGSCVALGMRAVPLSLKGLVQGVFVLPQTVPSIVYAVAVYFVFVQFGVSGSLLGIVIAHTCLALPFVVLIVSSGVYSLDPQLEEASYSLGAGVLRTFVKVILPRLYVSILGGALFAFQISFDETIVALFVSGVKTKTLPVKIWDSIFFEVSPILPAISTIIILVPLMISVPFFILLRTKKR
jgi:ABC-type spermidine/putrescine transport system permease subunit II